MTNSISSPSPDSAAASDTAGLNALLGSRSSPGSTAANPQPTDGVATVFADLLGSSCALPTPATGGISVSAANSVSATGLPGATLGAATLPQMLACGQLGAVSSAKNLSTGASDPAAGGAPSEDTGTTLSLNPALKRDVAEAIAALLAPLLAAGPSLLPVNPAASASTAAAGTLPAEAGAQSSAGPGGLELAAVTVNFTNGTSLHLDLSLVPPDSAGSGSWVDRIAAAIDQAAQPGTDSSPTGVPATSNAQTPPLLHAVIDWPAVNSAAAASVQPAVDGAASLNAPTNPVAPEQEIFAAGSAAIPSSGILQKQGQDINFLSPVRQSVAKSKKDSGTSVAISGATMPTNFTSHRVAVEPLVFATNPMPSEVVAMAPLSAPAATPAALPDASHTPAPALAQRAVDTVLNVVESQADRSSLGGTVNLNFNFGGDNLTVRVQMRGAEVQTRFLTDSPELRSALATEWHAVTGRGITASGLRLADPVFSSPASAAAPTDAGTAGQQFSSRQNSQQQGQSPEAFPGLPIPRRGAAVAAPARAATNRPAAVLPLNSLHLAAVA